MYSTFTSPGCVKQWLYTTSLDDGQIHRILKDSQDYLPGNNRVEIALLTSSYFQWAYRLLQSFWRLRELVVLSFLGIKVSTFIEVILLPAGWQVSSTAVLH